MQQKEMDEVIQGILRSFEGQVVSIILFGSMARGDHDEQSDVDIAVILSSEKTSEQGNEILDYFVDLDIKYGRVHSIIEIQKDEFDKWKDVSPFYKNVLKDGVVLWKAA